MGRIQVRVFIDRENKSKEMELDSDSVVSDLLNELSINPVTVIVSRGNELILDDERLGNGDDIRILSVISGG